MAEFTEPLDILPPARASRAARGLRLARHAAARVVAWRWLLLVNLFFVSPVLLYNLELRSGGRLDPVGLWNLATSVLVLAGLQLLARRPSPLLVAMFPLGFVVAADLFVVAEFDSRLTATYLTVIAHNLHDTGDFVQAFLPRLAPALALFLGFYGLAAWRLRGVELPGRRAWGLAALGLAALLHGGIAARHVHFGFSVDGAVYHVMVRDTSSPFGVLPQAVIAYQSHRRAAAALTAAEAFRFDATRARVDAPEVYVLVLGETCRPDHWGLNGYRRDTSPRLARTRGLVSFSDMASQAAFTSESVPLILTRGTAADPARAERERSIVSAFGEAGFRTAWLSGQEVSDFGGRNNHIAAEADTCRFFERRHDEVLLPPFERLLREVRAPEDKLLVVLHTMGSHFHYENRVPPAFRHYSLLPAGSGRERLVNAYDDTIRYTDHVLAELIARLEARRDVVSALFFVADHGENLMDDERRLMGHGAASRYDLAVAAFFWASPGFAALRPDAVALARARASAPLSSANVFDSLADMGGLVGPAFDRSRSVFSPALRPRPRLYVHQGRTYDFDRLPGR
ncbi:MAG: phosphoethanolamine transferase [Planctomycetes bacterium]|nr:phosphoethanolamine transferase [Planctomycetota bacterium]